MRDQLAGELPDEGQRPIAVSEGETRNEHHPRKFGEHTPEINQYDANLHQELQKHSVHHLRRGAPNDSRCMVHAMMTKFAHRGSNHAAFRVTTNRHTTDLHIPGVTL